MLYLCPVCILYVLSCMPSYDLSYVECFVSGKYIYYMPFEGSHIIFVLSYVESYICAKYTYSMPFMQNHIRFEWNAMCAITQQFTQTNYVECYVCATYAYCMSFHACPNNDLSYVVCYVYHIYLLHALSFKQYNVLFVWTTMCVPHIYIAFHTNYEECYMCAPTCISVLSSMTFNAFLVFATYTYVLM